MEQHPISVAPDLTPDQRLRWLEDRLGLLWDEVWWHQLPFYRRWFYWLQGFRSPVDRFYGYGPKFTKE